MADDRPVIVYSVGMVALSLCAKGDVTREQIESYANMMHPTGIRSMWAVSEDDFHTGEANPCPCNQEPGRLHYLLHC